MLCSFIKYNNLIILLGVGGLLNKWSNERIAELVRFGMIGLIWLSLTIGAWAVLMRYWK